MAIIGQAHRTVAAIIGTKWARRITRGMRAETGGAAGPSAVGAGATVWLPVGV
jgi:hypothetical protein